MRRKPGSLLRIEVTILEAALLLRRRGIEEFYGFLLAKDIKENTDSKLFVGFGTMYRALNRMEAAGYLQSRWENPSIALQSARPRRRLYKLTLLGEAESVKPHDLIVSPATISRLSGSPS